MSMLNMLLGYGPSFKAEWSGSSLVNPAGAIMGLLETSGSNYRATNIAATGPAAWGVANSDGTFTGNSTQAYLGQQVGTVVSGNNIGSQAVNELMQVNRTGWVSFSLGTKTFSGSSYANYSEDIFTLETSGGLIRFTYKWASYNGITYNGSYISLT